VSTPFTNMFNSPFELFVAALLLGNNHTSGVWYRVLLAVDNEAKTRFFYISKPTDWAVVSMTVFLEWCWSSWGGNFEEEV
jgi:hypothetical protein